MATILKAGNVATGAQITSDATGILEIRTGTGAGTTAITVGTDQAVTMGAVSSSSLTVNSNNISAVNSLGFRNRIINGDCRIDQRNAGASVTITNTAAATYVLDRWAGYGSNASRFSVQQNAGAVTPPSGYSNYLGVTSLSAYAVSAGDVFVVSQNIEGFNAADLGWGAAGAQSITISFWARSSLTGTFGGAIRNSADTRSYPFTYTISAANTWEYKTVIIAGDTTGTWLTNNGVGIRVVFGLGVGSSSSGTAGAWAGTSLQSATGATSVVGTNGATFYITGVQLEAGSVATPFERRDYGRELIMCQRYFVSQGGEALYERYANGLGRSTSTTRGVFTFNYPVTMRSSPTVSTTSLANMLLQASTVTAVSIDQATARNITLYVDVASGLTSGIPSEWYSNNSTTPRVQFSAEL
jgi:hypothetical protein